MHKNLTEYGFIISAPSSFSDQLLDPPPKSMTALFKMIYKQKKYFHAKSVFFLLWTRFANQPAMKKA